MSEFIKQMTEERFSKQGSCLHESSDQNYFDFDDMNQNDDLL